MFIINGLLLGLSTGIFCLSWCIPIYAPLLLVEKRKVKTSLWVFLKFSLGRLTGYILFGAAVGFLGSKISGNIFQLVINLSMILLAGLMITYAFGLTIPQSKFCKIYKKIKPAFWLGFLTGINVCPPFLLALTQGLASAEVIKSILFFIMFFLGTTFYIFPFTFLSFFSNKKILRQIAQISAVIIGLVFLIQALLRL